MLIRSLGLLAVTAPQIIIADDAPALTASLNSPGFRAVMVQSSGNIIAAGTFKGSQGDDFTLVRYTSDGSQLDAAFGGDGVIQTNFSSGKPRSNNHDTLWGAGIDSQDRIVVSGHDKSGNLVVARYDADGSLDNTFSGNGIDKPGSSVQLDEAMHTIAFDHDDNIFIAGSYGGDNLSEMRVIKYSKSGTLATSFGIGGVSTHRPLDGFVDSGAAPTNRPVSIVVGGNSSSHAGKVLIVGTAVVLNPGNRLATVLRLNSVDGTLDTTFSNDGDGIVTTNIPFEGDPLHNNYGTGITIDASDRILISGISSHGMNVIRYEPNGDLDTTFNAIGLKSDMAGVAIINSPSEAGLQSVTRGRDLVVDALGRIVVGGTYEQNPSSTVKGPAELDALVVARLNDDGTLDSGFGTNGSGVFETLVGDGWNELTDITISPDGDVWASGHACSAGGNCSSYGNGEPFDSVLLRIAAPNDTPGMTVSPTSILTSEDGGTAQFDVVLDTEPVAAVSIAVTSSNAGEGVVVDATSGVLTLAFDATNWDVPQSVTVQGVDDGAQDGDQPYQIFVASSSIGDPGYDSLNDSVTAINQDNETPSAVALYIHDIRFESKRGNKDWRAVFEIRSDANGNGQGDDSADSRVAGVLVEVTFAGQTYSDITDSNGIFRTGWITNLASGLHYANAVAVALTGFTWDPLALDLEDDSDGDGKPDDSVSV